MDLSHIVPELRENVLPVESLKFDPQNVRVHDDENMTAVRNSLRRFGMRHAIIVRGEDNIVIAGNARLQAAIDLGWEYVPVTYANDLSDSEATLLAITDNKTSDLGGWNEDLLSSVLKEIEQDDVTLSDMFNLGWSDKELTDLGVLEIEEAEIEPPEESSKQSFCKLSFTVHESQKEMIDQALSMAINQGHGESNLNRDEQGNALHEICTRYLG